jgi:hypothetical protein
MLQNPDVRHKRKNKRAFKHVTLLYIIKYEVLGWRWFPTSHNQQPVPSLLAANLPGKMYNKTHTLSFVHALLFISYIGGRKVT